MNTNKDGFEVILDTSSFMRLSAEQLKKITKFFKPYTFDMNIIEINQKNKRMLNETPFDGWESVIQLQKILRILDRRPDKQLVIDSRLRDRAYLSSVDKKLASVAINNPKSILVTNDKQLRKTVHEYGGYSIDVFSLYHFASEMEVGIEYSSIEDMYSNYTPLSDDYEYCIS